MFSEPELLDVRPAALDALSWTLPTGVKALASAPVNGGLTEPQWLLNVRVARTYNRTDLAQHAAEIASETNKRGEGITLFTSARIDRWRRATNDGAVVDCTAGISKPTLAASSDEGWSTWAPGTINIVAFIPAPLHDSAAVNAVMTITEAKCQALAELGVPGTGTASDAVVVLWPAEDQSEPFCGPRSTWGSRLARAAFDAVSNAAVAATDGLTR